MYTIFSLSDSDKHFSSAIAEYSKRMGKKVEIQNIRPIKYGTQQQIITKETKLIQEKIQKRKKKGDIIVLLSKEGETKTTEQFTTLLSKTGSFCFVIGGPYGVDEKSLSSIIDIRVSLGSHTMPHGLVKLVLMEQIYRVDMIQAGRSYHY